MRYSGVCLYTGRRAGVLWERYYTRKKTTQVNYHGGLF